ncbi:HTH-type transcriptional regulator TnrA [bacterium BMS3Abin01]|nr:HTH-type transcriptional regulator TnrA [bacterium BMS3Abin01]HDZ60064.1 MerR family transcriptional regulator [Actinomycetota bacterium]
MIDGTEPDGGSMPLNIGAVVELLEDEFPDVSISKIRYLEDERLIAPKRSAGGYRKFSKADIERIRTILTLQRDEFLPLKVIRQELSRKGVVAVRPAGARRFKKVSLKQDDKAAEAKSFTLAEALETSGADEGLVRELEDYGLISGQSSGGTRRYDQTDVEVMAAASDLAEYGVAARNLRTLKSSVDRESALLLQILSPTLRSRNPQTRKEGIAALENLATVSSYLKHLLLIKDLRNYTTR